MVTLLTQMYSLSQTLGLSFSLYALRRYSQTMHVKERFFPWTCIAKPPKMAALGLDHLRNWM